MTELVELIGDHWWVPLLLVPLAFGFLPGTVLRVIVLLYPSGDPRRKELVAELYAMPFAMRPVWTAQQIETALFEGGFPRIGDRFLDWRYRPRLKSGVRRNRKYPDSFYIPSKEAKQAITPGTDVKVMYDFGGLAGERIWVRVEQAGRVWITGRLINHPVHPGLQVNQRIRFRRAHIIDSWQLTIEAEPVPVQDEEGPHGIEP